jgi:hypothetical protein
VALLTSSCVKYVIGNYANLGKDAPNYNIPMLIFFRFEVVASSLLMLVKLLLLYKKPLKVFLLCSQGR